MRELGLVESFHLHQAGSRAIESLDGGKPDLPAVITAIAVSVDKDQLRVAGLPQADLDALIAAWRPLNGVLFQKHDAAEVVTGRASKKRKVRWRDIYSTLIAAGHNPQRITKYTERQMNLYYEGAQVFLIEERISRIHDFNAAQAGGKHTEGVVKKLREFTK